MTAKQQFRTPGDDIEHVAVAVCRWPDGGTHSGLIYRHNKQLLCLIHLADDRKLVREVFLGKYGWIVPNLLEPELENICSVCRFLSRKMPQYRYCWILDIDASLDKETGELVSRFAPNGLTCSTFVLAVFKTAQIRFIDTTGWPQRPEDEARYRGLHSHFQNMRMEEDKLQYLIDNIRTIRVRPEEVAGACLSSDFPATFQVCEPYGRRIIDQLISRFENRSVT